MRVNFLTYVWFKEKELEAAAVSGWLDVRGFFSGGNDSVWSVKSILAESPCWRLLYLDISCGVSGTC